MRTIRTLTIAAAIGAMLPTMSAAQSGRDFKDAWFWGLKVGGLTIADSAGSYVQAPTVGLDWLITRNRGGVYIAASQTFFSQHTLVLVDPTAADLTLRPIRLKNLRRFDVLAMGYPGSFRNWHPYVGAGFTVAQIATATPEGFFGTTDELALAEAYIDNSKVSFSPVFMAGAQFSLRYFSVFGQASLSPAQKDFLLYNGRPINLGYEIGFRYNIGPSVERD